MRNVNIHFSNFVFMVYGYVHITLDQSMTHLIRFWQSVAKVLNHTLHTEFTFVTDTQGECQHFIKSKVMKFSELNLEATRCLMPVRPKGKAQELRNGYIVIN